MTNYTQRILYINNTAVFLISVIYLFNYICKFITNQFVEITMFTQMLGKYY